ncbi:MAG TPA: ATP synthase F1 subunit epsilon [Acidimicrobiales bacterium]|nr:ATP synthase F1 subunit epsilon [Acidimicrobiales bacterium]
MASFPASLVTPERIVLEGETQVVMVRTEVGDATFLAGHTDLIGALVPGLVRFQQEDGSFQRAAVHGGFVKVEGGKVVILAPVAELAEEIDLDRARLALEEAERALAELGARSGAGAGAGAGGESAEAESADPALAEAEHARKRAEVRIEVAGAA